MKKRLLTISALLLLAMCNTLWAKDVYIDDDAGLKKAIKGAEAGDNIILKNGTYKNIRIVFYGEGTAEKPITLKAETPGKVFIEGESNLQIGGHYLYVEGLYFRNGYTPTRNVIRFKIDNKRIAFHSKVTNSVIEEFTQKDREKLDHWVEFWGQHNELSNNYITGKSNFGPTVMIELKGNEHVNNYHQIINNYFGPRPRKGGPHGETIQLGNSTTSMTPSYTNVENNLFYHCNGEVEVISSKSNFNRFKNNVFFESEGSLVLRHGNYDTIDGNVFIGDGKNEFIGGVRVVNTGHWITNNYFYKLIGKKFRAPIAVMNGIPKSPLNRYNQVTDVVVAHNSWVESPTPWYFSVGSNVAQSAVLPKSEIRSARPVRTLFANNLIYNSTKADQPIYAYDKVDGVKFKNNVSNNGNASEVQTKGLVKKKLKMAKISDYLMVPTSNITKLYNGFDFDKIDKDLLGHSRTKANSVGAFVNPVDKNTVLVDKTKYGTTWFNPEKPAKAAQTFSVATTEELLKAVEAAANGDVIELSAASYSIAETIAINKTLRITSAKKSSKAVLMFSGANTAFLLQPKSHLQLDGVSIKGNGQQDAFATLDKYMSKAYDLTITNTDISNFKNVLDVSKGSFADSILVDNVKVTDCANGFMLNKEIGNKGDYNVEFLTVTNSMFDNIAGAVLDYHRGGYDESTIGGNLVFKNNKVTNSGKAQESGMLIKNLGIVHVTLQGNTFKNNPVKLVAILWGEKGQKPVDNKIINSGEVKIVQNIKLDLMY